MRRFVLLVLVFLLPAAIVSPSAEGSLLLSTHASDGINPPLAEDLDALLDFSINVDGQLELAVTNLTPEEETDPSLKINEIYFNVSDNITGLDLFKVGNKNPNATEWTGQFAKDSILINSFGEFDVSIIDGVGADEQVIDPGETLIFKFNVTTGGGSYSDMDFIFKSYIIDHPGHTASYAAAKFYNSLPEMSAYGATNVPEPGTICLLGLGGLLLRRRKL